MTCSSTPVAIKHPSTREQQLIRRCLSLQPIRWGILGCGDVCEVKSGPAFYKAPHSRLVAVMVCEDPDDCICFGQLDMPLEQPLVVDRCVCSSEEERGACGGLRETTRRAEVVRDRFSGR